MIITRTPFRITLGGGATDLPSYYEKYGGFIFSAGIDRYMFVSINRPMEDDLIRLKYTQSEAVERVDQLHHYIAREILRLTGVEKQTVARGFLFAPDDLDALRSQAAVEVVGV